MSVTAMGLDELIADLKRFADQLPGEMYEATVVATDAVHDATTAYPPERPGQKYVRTFTYADEQIVTYGQDGTTVWGEVETPTSYARYLRGDGEGYMGAWMHVGRWESLEAIVERLMPGTVIIFENRIDGLVYRIFGE